MSGSYTSSSQRAWRDSDYICALADAERHLGHLVKTDVWHAYDATHANASSNGMNYLGEFADLDAAKQAVEVAVAGAFVLRTMSAGGR